MAEISKFFNSAPGDPRNYQASDFADYFGSVLSTGLLHTDNIPGLEVKCEGTDLRTYVTTGKAIMQGYMYENTSDLYLDHALPEPTLDRIDRIVLRLDKRNQSRFIKLFVVQGEPATDPVPPSLTRDEFIYELSLAQIRVRANTSTLNPADLVDERLDENLCGLVSSLITIPTSQFQQQWDDFMADIQDNGFASQTDFNAHLADTASQDEFGHVKIGSGINVTDGVISVQASDIPATGGTDVQSEIDSLKSSVSSGKQQVATAITDKGGTVADGDGDGVPTFQELSDGVNSIQVGDYSIGDVIPISSIEGPVYGETFETQFVYGWTVDDNKNVYYWGTSNVIIKKDYNGNILWTMDAGVYFDSISSIAVSKDGTLLFVGGKEVGSDYGRITLLDGSNGLVIKSIFDRHYHFPNVIYISDTNNRLYTYWYNSYAYHNSSVSRIYALNGTNIASSITSSYLTSNKSLVDFSADGNHCYFANGSTVYRYRFDGIAWSYNGNISWQSAYHIRAFSGGVRIYSGSVKSDGNIEHLIWHDTGNSYTSNVNTGSTYYSNKILVYLSADRTKFTFNDAVVFDGQKGFHRLVKSGESFWFGQQGNSNWMLVSMARIFKDGLYSFVKFEEGIKILS